MMLSVFILENACTPGFTSGVCKEGPYLEFQGFFFLFKIRDEDIGSCLLGLSEPDFINRKLVFSKE